MSSTAFDVLWEPFNLPVGVLVCMGKDGLLGAQLASDLNVDAHQMHQILEKAVREHLQDLGEMAVRID